MPTHALSGVRRLFMALVLSSVVLSGCSGDSLPIDVPPATVGQEPQDTLGWLNRSAIDAWLRWNVWRGSRSGFVAAFALNGVPVYATAAGWADIESRTPMTLDTRMRFASMTKPITAVAALMLVEAGTLSLDDRVDQYLPAFRSLRVAQSTSAGSDGHFDTVPADPALTVRHLLMFASGIGPGQDDGSALWRHWQANGPRTHAEGTLAERIDALAELPLFEQPGQRWRYGWSADVLARVVEVASGQAFDSFLEANIFNPLGMSDTHFRYADPDPDQIATVYTQDEDGKLIAQLPDSDTDFPEGGSGLVSTASDYLRFALMLYNQGEYQGTRLISADTVANMRQLHVASGVLENEGIEGLGWGLGLSVVADADATAFGDRTGDFWWSGYFGTTFFISPETGLVGVVLSQNEPGPYSGQPVALYVVQGLALGGL